MKIERTQQRGDASVEYGFIDDLLTVNGDTFDFSAIPDGGFIEYVPCQWIVGPVRREGGEIILTLIQPIAAPRGQAVNWKAEEQSVVTPQKIEAGKVGELRARRDALLFASDWTQLPDAPVDQKRWAIYRQQLRDMVFDKPEWPERPGAGLTTDDALRIEKHIDRAARKVLFDGKNKP